MAVGVVVLADGGAPAGFVVADGYEQEREDAWSRVLGFMGLATLTP